MSAKKKMNTKNNVEDATMSPNERILKNITELYTSGTSGGGERLSTVAMRDMSSPHVATLAAMLATQPAARRRVARCLGS
jgi:hypothetical protein